MSMLERRLGFFWGALAGTGLANIAHPAPDGWLFLLMISVGVFAFAYEWRVVTSKAGLR